MCNICEPKNAINEFLDEHSDELTPEQKRQRNIDRCGWNIPGTKADGSVGMNKAICGFWRFCPNCYRIRVSKFRTRLTRISEDVDDAVAIVCENSVANSLIRKRAIKAEDYFRSPVSEDTVIITISKALLDKVKFSDYLQILDLKDENGEVRDLIVNSYVDIPERKRTSGGLCKEIEIEEKEPEYAPIDEEDTIVLELVNYIADPSHSQDYVKLFGDAIMATSSEYHRGLEKDVVLAERCEIYESLLRQNEIEFSVLKRNEVKVSRVWLNQNFVFIERKETVEIKSSIDFHYGDRRWTKPFRDYISTLFATNKVVLLGT